MKIFSHPLLNNILFLFEHKIHEREFEQQLLNCLMLCNEETLMLRSKDYGNILYTLCQLPKYHLKPGFTNGFICLMNHIILRLNLANKQVLNIDLLMDAAHQNSIFILLLNSQNYQAAEACLHHLKILAQQLPIIKSMVLSQLLQKNRHGQFHLTELYKNLNWQYSRHISLILVKSYLHFNIPKKIMMDWLFSTLGLNAFNLSTLITSPELLVSDQRRFFYNFVLFCDFEIIQKDKLMRILNPLDSRFDLLDFTFTQQPLNLDTMKAILHFYEDLFRHHHLSINEYYELILNHPKPGFSPMHQLIFQGHHLGLSCYLDHLNYLLQQQIITSHQVREAFLKTNTKGFTCFYQAMNNIHKDIPNLFLKHLMHHFSKEEVLSMLTKGSYNPLYERYFKPRCAHDKSHAKATNQMLTNIRQLLRDELQRTITPISEASFFNPGSATTSPIPSDDSIGLELEKLGII